MHIVWVRQTRIFSRAKVHGQKLFTITTTTAIAILIIVVYHYHIPDMGIAAPVHHFSRKMLHRTASGSVPHNGERMRWANGGEGEWCVQQTMYLCTRLAYKMLYILCKMPAVRYLRKHFSIRSGLCSLSCRIARVRCGGVVAAQENRFPFFPRVIRRLQPFSRFIYSFLFPVFFFFLGTMAITARGNEVLSQFCSRQRRM